MSTHQFPGRTGLLVLLLVTAFLPAIYTRLSVAAPPAARPGAAGPEADALAMVAEGREAFRFDTFGDEEFWGGTLQLHTAIAGLANGGVGDGLSPAKALELGLKVDAAVVDPAALGAMDEAVLANPATTLSLLRADAVVGVKGFFHPDGTLRSVGITCALCHSVVDDSVAPGIGQRRDGWANRDLNVGAIISLAPNLTPFTTLLGVDEDTVKRVLAAWGPGKFDAELVLDGKGFQPDGVTSAATLIPPAFGLAGVNLHTWTGWGGVSHWNAFVANLEMHGNGRFFDPRLRDAKKFPIAAANGFDNITKTPDRITPKLPALHVYQLSLLAPAPPAGSFNAGAAARGETLFMGKAGCVRCHVPPIFTEPGWNMHTGAEIGIDEFQAKRSPDERYRTSPLKGLWTHTKGGFFHDGRFPTLGAVVNHYNSVFGLGLEEREKRDLVEYLNSL